MLVEMAIADSYGAGREYVDPVQAALLNDGSTYMDNPVYDALKLGRYTDDTQMSIAVAECLMAGTWSKRAFAKHFVQTFKRDPRKGYARSFQAFLESIENEEDFLQKIKPWSDKSGAAMRAGPIGCLRDINQVLEVAVIQAELTHATDGGRWSARAAALMVHHQYWRLGSLQDLPQFLAYHIPQVPWHQEWQGPTGELGVDITRAALSVLQRANSLTDVLKLSVAQEGDTDTLATIAMASASRSNLPNDLDPNLYSSLENGDWGLKYLRQLDLDFDNWIMISQKEISTIRF